MGRQPGYLVEWRAEVICNGVVVSPPKAWRVAESNPSAVRAAVRWASEGGYTPEAVDDKHEGLRILSKFRSKQAPNYALLTLKVNGDCHVILEVRRTK